MNNFQNQHWNNNQQTNQNNQQQANSNQQNTQTTNNQTQQNQPNQQTPGLMQTLLNATLPALMQHFTGQQIAMGGSNPDTQLVLSQVLMLQ